MSIADDVLALEQENQRLYKALESLTPGGSEFYHNPDRCVLFVRGRLDTVIEQAKRRKDAEAEVERLTKELENRKPDPNVDKLLDLMEEDIAWQEKHQTPQRSERIAKIIEVYRALRPIAKEGQA